MQQWDLRTAFPPPALACPYCCITQSLFSNRHHAMTKGYLYIAVLPPRRRQELPPLTLLHHLEEAIYEEGASFSMYLWTDGSD